MYLNAAYNSHYTYERYATENDCLTVKEYVENDYGKIHGNSYGARGKCIQVSKQLVTF